MTKQTKAIDVFLSLNSRSKRSKPAGFPVAPEVKHYAEWLTNDSERTRVYKSKACETAAEAERLAHAWLEKQNRRPSMASNVLAAMEWAGPKYRNTTTETAPCNECGVTCSTHKDACNPLARCIDCNKATCPDHRDEAGRCTSCAASKAEPSAVVSFDEVKASDYRAQRAAEPVAEVYGSGPITPANLTNDQIVGLLVRTEAEIHLQQSTEQRSNLTATAGACRLALKSRNYHGSVRRICDLLNEQAKADAERVAGIAAHNERMHGKRVAVTNSAETHAAIAAGNEPGALARIMAWDGPTPVSGARTDELTGTERDAVTALVNHMASVSLTERRALVKAIAKLVEMPAPVPAIRGGSSDDRTETHIYRGPGFTHRENDCPCVKHPDGTPMDRDDIADLASRNANMIKRDEQRARYIAQYPECMRRPFYSGKAWPLCGVEELRNAVEWANSEPEDDHEWQTAEDILTAYRKACTEGR